MATNTLVLDSLNIKGFRAFRDLKIEKLGRVNLITGKNNVGKTSVLEALRIYARRGAPVTLRQLLLDRDETYYSNTLKSDDAANLVSDLRHLFYGRPNVHTDFPSFYIGSDTDIDNGVEVSIIEQETRTMYISLADKGEPEEVPAIDTRTMISVHSHEEVRTVPLSPNTFGNRYASGLFKTELKQTFVLSKGIPDKNFNQWWDSVALTNLEDDVTAALRIITPGVDRINLISLKEGNPDRIAIVKLRELPSPVTLRSMGEGISRLFGLSLALVNSGNGILLVDEIETGLHYSVQLDMWRLIFKTAERLNVQVFATTHSYDCIKAFQKASSEDAAEQGVLIRLQNKNGEVVPTNFDEEELEIATQEGIEVR